MNENEIAVVIPVYNSGNQLLTTFNSVVMQPSDRVVRVVLVDDASTDDVTLVILREFSKYPNVDVVVNSVNRGICASRNIGLSIATKKCEYVLFLDHDDVLTPTSLDSLASILDKDSSLVAVMGVSGLFGDNVTEVDSERFIESQRKRRFIRYSPDKTFQEFEACDYLTSRHLFSSYTYHPPSKVMLRTGNLLRNDIRFNPKFELVEDWVFLHDTLNSGRIRVIEDVVTSYHIHDQNSSHSPKSKTQLQRAWVFLLLSNIMNLPVVTDILLVTLYDSVISKCSVGPKPFSPFNSSNELKQGVKWLVQWSAFHLIFSAFYVTSAVKQVFVKSILKVNCNMRSSI